MIQHSSAAAVLSRGTCGPSILTVTPPACDARSLAYVPYCRASRRLPSGKRVRVEGDVRD